MLRSICLMVIVVTAAVGCNGLWGLDDLSYRSPDAASPYCGDGVIGPGESCDGADLGGLSCAQLTGGEGTLTCRDDCSGLDTGGCTGGPFGNGADGAAIVTGAVDLTTESLAPDRSCGDAVRFNIEALMDSSAMVAKGSEELDPGECLQAGDEVVIIHLQAPSPADVANVGHWELLRVASVAGGTVTFESGLTQAYGGSDGEPNIGIDAGQHRVVLQRVPSYQSLQVAANGVLTAGAYDCESGGTLFIKVASTLTVAGVIDLSARGFGGGTAGALSSETNILHHGRQGDSYGGDCNPGTGESIEANLGGGGGATSLGTQDDQPGGGGGGHLEPGSAGVGGNIAGKGGLAYGAADLRDKIYLGSGGGGGGNNTNGPAGGGGRGGGIIGIFARDLSVTGKVTADGQAGEEGCNKASGGGGGAGGSVLIYAATLGGAENVSADGGPGGLGGSDECTQTCCGDDGGSGSQGRVQLDLASP